MANICAEGNSTQDIAASLGINRQLPRGLTIRPLTNFDHSTHQETPACLYDVEFNGGNERFYKSRLTEKEVVICVQVMFGREQGALRQIQKEYARREAKKLQEQMREYKADIVLTKRALAKKIQRLKNLKKQK